MGIWKTQVILLFIKKFRLQNYKSISDSGWISLDRKINAFIGKNNVGKTSVIEAIYKIFRGRLNTIYTGAGGSPQADSILQNINNPVCLDLALAFTLEEEETINPFIPDNFLSSDITVNFTSGGGIARLNDIYIINGESADYIFKAGKVSGQADVNRLTGNNPQGLFDLLYGIISNSFLFISGNRNVPTDKSINNNETLNTTASNLHSVLHAIHSNREEVFDQIRRSFTKVFTDVRQIRTPVLNNNMTNVNLDIDQVMDIPLQECGSGLAHALIILCALFSQSQRVILFDEPHSYLHPSAEKAIYDLVAKQDLHQFVFTTHSPILINYPAKKTSYMVSKASGKTIFSPLNKAQEAFNEIGISNSDFALAERVIFVEGRTEEVVLPIILGACGIEQLDHNYKIINIEGTGNRFDKESAANQTATLHEKIFCSLSDNPIPYRFMIDRDERTEEKIQALKGIYKDKLLVLNRREIENYFLVPESISEILSVYNVNIHAQIISQDIAEALQKQGDKTLFPKGCIVPADDVKASNVLNYLFEKCGAGEYGKVEDGKLLVESIISNGRGDFHEIRDLFGDFF